MPYQAGLTHTIPELKTGAKHCSRCGRDFHLFRSKKNCRNCGCLVCENCSGYKTKLPQFGYLQDVRVCSYCAHFLRVYRMDAAALSKLNIKTLRGYLQSYNISTKGMLEKQELINAIQSHRPIPDSSEIYFRAHLPPDAAPGTSSFFDELFGSGSDPESSASASGSGATSKKPTASAQAQSSSSSTHLDGDGGWSWDPDKFFAKLFGFDDSSESSRPSEQPPRPPPKPTSRPQAAPPLRPQADPRQQQQHQHQQQQRPTPQAQSYPYSQPQGSYHGHPYPPYPPYPTPQTQMPPGYTAVPHPQAHQQGTSWMPPHGAPFSNGPYPSGPSAFPGANYYPGSIPHPGFHHAGPPPPQPHMPHSFPQSNYRPTETRPTETTSRPTETERPTENTRSRTQTTSDAGETFTASSETFTRSSRTYSSSSPPSTRPPTSQSPQQSSGSGGGRLTLEDVMSPNVNLSTLSIKVIKSLLDAHSVTYVGVVEKSDLVARLQTLIDNTKAEQGIRDPSPPPPTSPASPTSPRAPQTMQEDSKPTSSHEKDEGDSPKAGGGQSKADSSQDAANASSDAAAQPHHYSEDEDLCKICYDAKLNCVMLNCGHLATCQPCGKLIMDGTRTCPICRQYVVRLLHVFRA